jgi:hypothetical protein
MARVAENRGAGDGDILRDTSLDLQRLRDPVRLVDAREELGVVRNLARQLGVAAEISMASTAPNHP